MSDGSSSATRFPSGSPTPLPTPTDTTGTARTHDGARPAGVEGPRATPTPAGVGRPRDGLDSGAPGGSTGTTSARHTGITAPVSGAAYQALEGYQSATPAQRAQIDALMASLPECDKAALRDILRSPAWQDHAVRDDILKTVANLPATGEVAGHSQYTGSAVSQSPVQAYAQLCQPRPGQTTPPLLDRANDGTTLAHQLARVATTPPDAEVLTAMAPHGQKEILAELVREIQDPGRINQGNMGSCGATTIQHQLVSTNPAEYARLSAGLSSPGTVTMRNGETLRRDIDSLEPTATSMRSPTERLFQGALMEYGSPANYRYDTATGNDIQDGNVADRLPFWARLLLWIFLAPVALALELIPLKQGGLVGWEYDKAAEGVFGTDQTQRYSYSGLPNSQESQLERLRELSQNGDLTNRGVAISLKWGAGHFLNVDRIDDSTTPPSLICRNPHGSYHGYNPGDPLRSDGAPAGTTIEDPARGTIRIPLTPQNTAMVSGIYYPSAMRS